MPRLGLVFAAGIIRLPCMCRRRRLAGMGIVSAGKPLKNPPMIAIP